MSRNISIATPIHDFFQQHLISQRGLSTNTVLAYRDALKLLLQYITEHYHKDCTDITIEDITADAVKQFLHHLENDRHNSVKTRNARLAAIHAFSRYLAALDPRLMAHCQPLLAVPFKRCTQSVFEYLERDEVQRIFNQIDFHKSQGLRDNAVFRMLYNTGMRAQELVNLDVNNIRFNRPYYVRILGKGRKERTCPLWPETMRALKTYLEKRLVRFTDAVPLFVNSQEQRLTRFGLRYIISRHVELTAKTCPSLQTRNITPHSFRHTTAMHLLHSGVDLNMIRSWLGHSSIETTHTYVEIDLEMKRKTLKSCERLLPKTSNLAPSWQRNPGILEWLSKL